MTLSPSDWFFAQSAEARGQILDKIAREFDEELEYNERHGIELLVPAGMEEALSHLQQPAFVANGDENEEGMRILTKGYAKFAQRTPSSSRRASIEPAIVRSPRRPERLVGTSASTIREAAHAYA